MRWSFAWGALLLLLTQIPPARAEKLEQLLEENGIPAQSFSPEELATEVSGAAGTEDGRTVVSYGEVDRLTSNALLGPRWIVSLEKSSGAVQRKQISAEETKSCGGAPEEISFADDFILLQTHINPSAGCTLVLDANLALQKTLYGFAPVRVAPNQIVIIEDMIHFAPVHPERLQLVDLTKWTNSELYPPRGDLLRKALAAKNAAKMPSETECTANNESCDPYDFDETLDPLVSDGRGRVAFIATQQAAHVRKEGEPAETVASQKALYVYQKQGSGWRYCQVLLQDSDTDAVKKELGADFQKAAARCVPRKIVFPDLNSQKYNPFIQ